MQHNITNLYIPAETVSLSSSLRRSNKLYLTSGDFLLVHIPSMTEYKDCSCVINLDKDLQEDNCYDLPPTCSCLNQTIFNSSLQVCKHDSLSNAVIVQLHNLVDIMNGTTLFFSNSKFCTNMPSSRLPFIIYLYSLRISIGKL